MRTLMKAKTRALNARRISGTGWTGIKWMDMNCTINAINQYIKIN
jgi:hypothetical protein